MESVTKFFKEENDFLYRKGEVKGIEKGIEKGMTEKELAFTRNLLSSTDLSVSKIAQLVGVSEDFVLKVKNELKK